MVWMEATDAAAVAQARAGDADAFRRLVERHSRRIFRLAFRLTGNEQDAEDVVQDTFLKAYREIGQFESRANFGTWLYRIAANCAIDLVRSRNRHHDRRADASVGDGPDETPVASGAPAPDRLVFSQEVRTELSGALEWLTPLERAAFVLRHYEERSIEEIGGILGLKTNATKHSIFRAVRKVRTALAPVLNR